MARTLVSLDGQWKIKDFEASTLEGDAASRIPVDETWMDAAVPGDVHAALLARGLIPDPLVGENAHHAAWVTGRDWCYARRFTLEHRQPSARLLLVFEGLDTFCAVWLNGKKLGDTDNMFREYRFDVTALVREEGENSLILVFRSIREALKRFDNPRYVSLFNDRRIFIRKAQCQFGWDWAPDLPSTGIWKSCSLQEVDGHELTAVRVDARRDGNLSFFVETDHFPARTELDGIKPYDAAVAPRGELTVEVRDATGRPVARETAPVMGSRSYLNLAVHEPRLWWPNGYGTPYLYSYTVTLRDQGRTLDERAGRFGIRDVELRQEPRGSRRFSFTFVVNGVPVFCKGANWVPAEVFPGTTARERYRALMERAAEAHFTMLRVWGGGIYENDAFYDLCDEMGILVFQEFMCACSDLPGDAEWFRAAVIPEVEHQVRRLRNHPSIIYWSGGNETAGIAGYRPAYGEELLRYTLRGVFGELDPRRPYGASSPTSFSDLGSDHASGDSHISAFEPVCVNGSGSFRGELRAIQTRFNSEMAYMGPVRYRSLVRYMPANHLWPLDALWDERNRRNPYSWLLRDSYTRLQERLAEDLYGKCTSVRDFLKKAMTAHAELLSAEIEYHRSRKWENSGVMFWMYNDSWPTGTFSVIDYYLLPKPAFYAVKRAYQPLIVTIQECEDGQGVFIVNDLRAPVRGRLEMGQADVNGRILWRKVKRVSVAGNGCTRVGNLPVSASAAGVYSFARLRAGTHAASRLFSANLWKGVAWPDPGLTHRLGRVVEKKDGIAVEVVLRTERFARMVCISHPDDARITYSDNFFDLEAAAEKTVLVRAPFRFDPGLLKVDHWHTEWD